MAQSRHFDIWKALEAATSAVLIFIALVNSVRLWQKLGVAVAGVELLTYWLLPIGFELAKNCFFASGVRRGGGPLAVGFFVAAFVFSLFSLTGQAAALLATEAATTTKAEQVLSTEDALRTELAGIPAELARQNKIIDTYDQSYRDYASVVAAAAAEKARLQARADQLRLELSTRGPEGTAPASSSPGAAQGAAAAGEDVFLQVMLPLGRTEAPARAARFRLFFMGGTTFAVEYGGLFMLAVALTHDARRKRRVRATAQATDLYLGAHIVAAVRPDKTVETLCGRAFTGLPGTARPPELCPLCAAKRQRQILALEEKESLDA